MNRARMMVELLEVLNDSTVDGIWRETTLWGYLAEGQDKFCEKTGYFKDISNFTLTLQTDVAVYAIPDRIIQIMDIWNGTQKLVKIPTGDIYYGEGISGVPTHWDTDRETGFIKLYPTPTSDENGDTLLLQVWRYSQNDLAEDGNDPEIPGRFQRACIEWAAFKAFSQHDMEQEDPIDAGKHRDLFRGYVKDGKKALKRYQNIEVRIGTDPAYRT